MDYLSNFLDHMRWDTLDILVIGSGILIVGAWAVFIFTKPKDPPRPGEYKKMRHDD